MSGHTISVDDAQFAPRVIHSDLPVLVDFWAPWCGPCHMVAPILEELAEEYRGRLLVAKVNTEDNHQQASRYRVQGIPTMILFQGGAELDRVVGAMPKALLKLWIEKTVGRAGAGSRRGDENRPAPASS